jgi:hypothetical protein
MDPVPTRGNLARGGRQRRVAAISLKTQLESCVELGQKKSICRNTRSSSAMSHRERTWAMVLAGGAADPPESQNGHQ